MSRDYHLPTCVSSTMGNKILRFTAMRQVVFVALLGSTLLPAVAHSASPDELAAETQDFVTLFPASEMQSLHKKMAIQTAVSLGFKGSPELGNCMKASMAPGVFDDASQALAKRSFSDAGRLKEINAFLQSAAGKKYMRHAVTVMETGLKQLQDGARITEAKPAVFSAEEMSVMQSFGARAAYKDYVGFSANLVDQLQANEAGKNKKVEEALAGCYQHRDGVKLTPTNRYPGSPPERPAP